MACLEMYNTNSTQSQPPMSPRISFSNDFVESQTSTHSLRVCERRPPPPSSSDFEFFVSDHSMLPADELFSKGRLLPFKDNNSSNNNGQMQRTLRDELLVDDEEVDLCLKPPKGSSSTNRWKGFLGLRKSHIGSKKSETSGSFDDDDIHVDAKRFAFTPEDANLTISLQSTVSIESQNSSDMEMGI